MQQRLNQVGGKGYGGAFLLGLVLGIVAAPCTTGFSVSIMLLISTGQNVVMGGAVTHYFAILLYIAI